MPQTALGGTQLRRTPHNSAGETEFCENRFSITSYLRYVSENMSYVLLLWFQFKQCDIENAHAHAPYYVTVNELGTKGGIISIACVRGGYKWSFIINFHFWCDFDRASSLICGNKMPTRCNRGFYCISYCLLDMFRASLYPSSGVQEYYTVVAACGISCCGFQVAGLVWSWGLCVRFAGCCCILQTLSWWA